MIVLSNIPTGVYKALLVLATVIWGYSFVVMKHVVDVVPPALLLGVRFTLAGLLLLVILHKRVKKHFSWNVVACGAVLALFDFSAFLTQTIGLQYTTPGINAFLTATYCVIVPFAWWVVAHKRPSICNVGAAVIAVIGIWLVAVTTSGETLTLGLGEGLTQICAVLFAIHIVLVSRFSKTRDVLVLTVFQFIFEGLFGLCVGTVFETPPALCLITPEVVGQMAFFGSGIRYSECVAGICSSCSSFIVLKLGVGVWCNLFCAALWRSCYCPFAARLYSYFCRHPSE